MKNIILSTLLSFLYLTVNAQSKPSFIGEGTSQEEYNYATRGIGIQRASGLDMKVGYELLNKAEFQAGAAKYTLEDLVRKSDGSFTCLVIRLQYSPTTEPRYMCVPNAQASAEIWEKYRQQLSGSNETTKQVLAFLLANRMADIRSRVK